MSDLLENKDTFGKIITKNPEMLSIFQYMESISRTPGPMLITGEIGTGKTNLAKVMHSVIKRAGEFVILDTPDLDDIMFPAALFGYVKGAFEGADGDSQGLIEKAKGGTLLLREISTLLPASQIKLLRLLQYGEYQPLGSEEVKKTDAYIIISTSVDIWALQRAGKFRKDLNLKMRNHHVHIPPLRERMEDIPLLVDKFLKDAAEYYDKKKPTPPKELYTLLQNYTFPGNVRELKDMVFEAVKEHKAKVLSMDIFKAHMEDEADYDVSRNININGPSPFKTFIELPTIKQTTKMLIEEALRRAGGNQSIAAKMLGISQPALSKRMKNVDKD